MAQTWDGCRLTFRYDENGSPCNIYYHNGTTGCLYTYIKNLQGDIVAIANTAGTIVATYTYDAWGKIRTSTDTHSLQIGHINPLRYRGYYYDAETEYYYLNSRYYNPTWGRFINADSIAGANQDLQSYNLFAYCSNNPINYTDSNGLGKFKDFFKSLTSNIKSISSNFSSAVASFAKSQPKSLPKTGQPNSSKTLLNPDGTPKQKRWYGPDGKAKHDRDYNHPGNYKFPHDHTWENGERGTDHLDPFPEYEFNYEPVVGFGMIVMCGIGVAIIIADDATGVGIFDDALLAPLITGIGDGVLLVFR